MVLIRSKFALRNCRMQCEREWVEEFSSSIVRCRIFVAEYSLPDIRCPMIVG